MRRLAALVSALCAAAILSVAARRGTGQGYRAASGVFVGDAVLMTLAAGGVGQHQDRAPRHQGPGAGRRRV